MPSAGSSAAPVLWDRLTWEEIAALRAGGMDMAILPVGATEQHGPHLALDVDTVSAVARGPRRSRRRPGVPVLPAIAYGCSLGHSRRWPGTIAVSPQVLIDLVAQIGDWVIGAGFRRLLILNGHVTNAAPLRCALELLRSRHDQALVASLSLHEISPRVREAYFADAEDWHANAAETSLMLEIAPGLGAPRSRGGRRRSRSHRAGCSSATRSTAPAPTASPAAPAGPAARTAPVCLPGWSRTWPRACARR